MRWQIPTWQAMQFQNGRRGTTSKLLLLGTVAVDGIGGRAVIDDMSQKKPRVFKVGDQIGDVMIVKIMRHAVLLGVNGKQELLTMKQRLTSETNSNKSQLQAAASISSLDDVTSENSETNIKRFLGLNHAVPHFNAGRMDGFYVATVTEESLFGRLGMKKGDIIEGLNGRRFGKSEDFNQFLSMDNSSKVRNVLQVRRQGRTMDLAVN